MAAIIAFLLKPAFFSGIVGTSAAGGTTTAGTWSGVAGQGGWSGKSSKDTSFRDSFEFTIIWFFSEASYFSDPPWKHCTSKVLESELTWCLPI